MNIDLKQIKSLVKENKLEEAKESLYGYLSQPFTSEEKGEIYTTASLLYMDIMTKLYNVGAYELEKTSNAVRTISDAQKNIES